jgi:DNA polymerase-3 subunit gamma/tau
MDEQTVLHQKYRPTSWGQVIGNKAVVSAFAKTVSNRGSQAFLLVGGSGVGKTTLSRIAAYELGCDEASIIEIDAATHTGIDDMRQLQEVCRYRPFGASQQRVIIVDEAHMLSKSAWNSILKATEEPPEYVSWFFCTTEASKVPATIKTRCAAFTLRELADKELGVLYDQVCEAEEIELDGSIGDLIIREAKGSPRQLLVNLAVCRSAESKQEAAKILYTVTESDPSLELCRFLSKGGSWIKAMQLLSKIEGQPESVRILVSNYFGTAIKNAKSDNEAGRFLTILDAFSQPYNTSDQMAPLMLSIGRVLFGG